MDVLTDSVHADRLISNLVPRSLWRGASLLMPAAVFAIALLSVGSVSAAPGFRVNSTGDGGDSAIGNSVCETAPGNGVCTLRAAIQEGIANANTSIGITFNIPTSDPGYNAQTGAWTINLTSALPDLSKFSRLEPTTMNITGPGAEKLTVRRSPNALLRIFNVTTSGSVNFSGITIANGDTPAGESGAGIQNVNSGTVSITNCTLTGNVSATGNFTRGGGIFNASNGTVSLTNSNVTFNRSKNGGGIYNKVGTINITNSTFANNSSSGNGGGIVNEFGTVNVSSSTFHDNGASFAGGGIFNTGTLRVINSTLYANIAFGIDFGGFRGTGGGILNNSLLNLTNSTVSANFSGAGGSGVCNVNATANVKNSIIALNYGGTTESAAAPDVSGAFTSQGFNLIGKKDGSTGFTLATDKKGTIAAPLDPKFDLRGLRFNGGRTQTIALQPDSPAIDQGSSAGLTGTLTTDQRGSGYRRTYDNSAVPNATGSDGTDIGALERQIP